MVFWYYFEPATGLADPQECATGSIYYLINQCFRACRRGGRWEREQNWTKNRKAGQACSVCPASWEKYRLDYQLKRSIKFISGSPWMLAVAVSPVILPNNCGFLKSTELLGAAKA